jgi:hypothetical protein
MTPHLQQHTDADGRALKEGLLHVLTQEEKWELTQCTPTEDYGSIVHKFGEHEGRKRRFHSTCTTRRGSRVFLWA